MNSSGNANANAQAMAIDPVDGMKPFSTYEPSAFKSTPRSNNLSLSSNPAGTPTPTDSMKITSGFVPKIRKNSPTFNSPSSTFGGVKNSPSSAFLPLGPQYTYMQPHPTMMQSPTLPPTLIQPDPIHVPIVRLPVLAVHAQDITAPRYVPPEAQTPLNPSELDSAAYPQDASENMSSEVKEEADDNSSDSQQPTTKKGSKKGKKERNRVSAQECRRRKKQYLESLEQQVIISHTHR